MENDLTVWCSLTGNWPETRELGEYYVRVMQDMVYRCLIVQKDGKPALPRFVCLTDKAIEGVECVVDPEMPASWWNKIWLFKYATTGRNLYFDLDTVLVNRLEPFVESLRGTSFTTLQDLAPGRVRQLATTGVFYWEGNHSDIYTKYANGGAETAEFVHDADTWKMIFDEQSGRVGGIGDGAWFQHMRPHPHYPWIQDVVGERAIQSFKLDNLLWTDWPKAGSSVVCLHGYPRPHQVTEGWLPKVWTIGGIGVAAWKDIVNVKHETMLAQIDENARNPNVTLINGFVPEHDRTVILCGGGPSLADHGNIQMIGGMQKCGAKVWALNGSYKFLRDQGITPDAMVVLDGRMENVRFLENLHGRTAYFLNLGCHPVLFERLKDYNVVGWFPILDDGEELLNKYQAKVQIGGGSTVGLRAIMLAWVWGYRNFKLFGYDSSYRRVVEGDYVKSQDHAYKQELNDGELATTIHIDDKTFHCARWMARQAEELRGLLVAMDEHKDVYGDCKFEVFGDGLFPYLITEHGPLKSTEKE